MILPGNPLCESELATLTGIPAEVAERAYLRSVDTITGREMVGRNGSDDYSGIAGPYRWPGEPDRIREWWLRLKNPPLKYKNGIAKPTMRYLGPPGRSPMLYFPPDTDPAWLSDTTMAYIIVEGPKKTLAAYALSLHGLGDTVDRPRWLAIGLGGVWGHRGKRGRTEDGQEIKGPIADFDRIEWRGRMVIILFDANVHTNVEVRWARNSLAKELRERGAIVVYVDLPADLPAEINGVDDLVGAWGPDRVIELINTKAYDPTVNRFFTLSDIGNAERLVDECGGSIRHCHPSNQWLFFDGIRHALDQTATVERLAKASVRKLSKFAFKIEDEDRRKAVAAFALQSEKNQNIRALLSRAAAEEGVPILMDDLDADPWLLNVQNGTIDLHTGKLRPHSRDDLISKLAPVTFDPNARCPRWDKFLEEVFAVHPDAIAFLQRVIGYALTGDVCEHCLFLLYGIGRNGKGTIFRMLLPLLGDYATTIDFATFIAGGDEHRPREGVAQMQGRRLVTAQEPSEGVKLNEGLIKWATGGDRLRGRGVYQRSSEWEPTHHLFLAVNHKPEIRGDDLGMWSRLRLIPFAENFEGREDKALDKTLLSELPGILNWCLIGCREWQRDGLGTCESVQAATTSYRTESDQIGRFIADECITGDYAQVGATKLYTIYKFWAERGGEIAIKQTEFGLRLNQRGYTKDHKETGNVYYGIGLRAAS